MNMKAVQSSYRICDVRFPQEISSGTDLKVDTFASQNSPHYIPDIVHPKICGNITDLTENSTSSKSSIPQQVSLSSRTASVASPVYLVVMNIVKRSRCCVPGCENKTSRRHRFPIKEPEVFQQWLRAINNDALLQMTSQQIYSTQYVCHDHFSEDVTVPGTRRGLKVTAVPTLLVPGPKQCVRRGSEMTISDEIIRLIDQEHNYCVKNLSINIVGANGKVDKVVLNKNISVVELLIKEGGTENEHNMESNEINRHEIENNIDSSTVEILEKSSTLDCKQKLEKNKKHALLKNKIVTHKKGENDIKKVEIKEKPTSSCSICSKKFPTKEEYNLHLEIHPPYMCDICGKTFRKSAVLKKHLYSHNDRNSFICEVCGKGYKDSIYLRKHLQMHQVNEPHVCHKCKKVFKRKRLLLNHIKFVHNKILKEKCTQCGLLFKNRSSLESHVKLVHLKIKPFQCDICQKKFGRLDYLQHHKTNGCCERSLNGGYGALKCKWKKVIINDKDELLPCKFCGKVVKDKVRLKRHLYTHINRHKCRFCPQTFFAKCIRNKHELIHQDMPVFFRCNVCYKKFETKEDLDEHAATQIHRRQPRYLCNVCGMKFHRRFTLSQHSLTEHVSALDGAVADAIIYDGLAEASQDFEFV